MRLQGTSRDFIKKLKDFKFVWGFGKTSLDMLHFMWLHAQSLS